VSRKLLIGAAPFAIAAAGILAWQVAETPAPEPEPIPVVSIVREGIGFPVIAGLDAFRINVQLTTLPIPPEAWRNLETVLNPKNGTIGIPVWRLRKGTSTRIGEVRIPSHPIATAVYALPPAYFQLGDVAVFEYTPALFTEAVFASVIDNASSDPTTMPGARVQFHETPAAGRRRSVR
jgi:hypothetical protein